MNNHRVFLPPHPAHKLAIFDLDETLIHSVDDIFADSYEVLVSIPSEMQHPHDKPTNENSVGFNV